MSRVMTFSRVFPSYHPNKGEPTLFVEQIYNSIGVKVDVNNRCGEVPEQLANSLNDFVILAGTMKKHHTIRAGNRWKVGDKFSPRVWSGKPYQSKQITIAPDIEIKKVWNIVIMNTSTWFSVEIEGKPYDNWTLLAQNDGLSLDDMIDWFKKGNIFQGQILCWNEPINY